MKIKFANQVKADAVVPASGEAAPVADESPAGEETIGGVPMHDRINPKDLKKEAAPNPYYFHSPKYQGPAPGEFHCACRSQDCNCAGKVKQEGQLCPKCAKGHGKKTAAGGKCQCDYCDCDAVLKSGGICSSCESRCYNKARYASPAEQWRAAREARRQERLASISAISGVVSGAMQRSARLVEAAQGGEDAPRVNRNNIRDIALRAARSMIGRHTQRELKLDFVGLRGETNRAASSDLGDGIAVVQAELKTSTGVRVPFEVPMRVLGGRLYDPSLILIDGAPRVIAPSTFRDLVESRTAYQDVSFRKMFDPPGPAYPRHEERRSRGMFASKQGSDALRQAIRGRRAEFEVEANPALLAAGGGAAAGGGMAAGGGLAGQLGQMAAGQAVMNKVDDMTKEGDVEKDATAGVDEPAAGKFGPAQEPLREQRLQGAPTQRPRLGKPRQPNFVTRPQREQQFDQYEGPSGLELDASRKEEGVSGKKDWTGEGNNPDEDEVMVGDRLETAEEIEVVQPGGHTWAYPERTACTVIEKTAEGYLVDMGDGMETILDPSMVRRAAEDDSHEQPEGDRPFDGGGHQDAGVAAEIGSRLDVMQKLTQLVKKLVSDGIEKADIHKMLQSQYPELAHRFTIIVGTDS